MFSERVSIQRTGRESLRAAAATATHSSWSPALAPNPPPTSRERRRTCFSSSPSISAIPSRAANACWLEAQTWRPLPSASGTARKACVSRGAGATRWFTKRALTTTSAPSRASGSAPKALPKARLVPRSGKRRGAPSSSASSGSTTWGRGSSSISIAAAASFACSRVSATISTIGSPTKRTVPSARGGLLNASPRGAKPARLGSPRSAAANTPATPPASGRTRHGGHPRPACRPRSSRARL